MTALYTKKIDIEKKLRSMASPNADISLSLSRSVFEASQIVHHHRHHCN